MEYEPAFYTDGTPVMPGDRIRYHQAPGGMLQDSSTFEWKSGTAVISDRPRWATVEGSLPDIVMRADDDVKGWGGSTGGIYGIVGHVIERLAD